MTLDLRPADHTVRAVSKRWPEVGREWAAAVPGELAALCRRFDAVPVRTLRARYGFVVEVTTANGPRILRASPDPAGLVQAEVSRALDEVGAGPPVYEIVATETGTWTMMERIAPGVSLDQAELSRDLVHAVGDMLRRLSEQPAPLPDMRRIDQWLRDRLNDDHLADIAPGHVIALFPERQRALSILDDLADRRSPGDLCHGDLHPGNVLRQADGRLFLIDPRGVSGEVAYDVAVLALKAVGGALAAAPAAAAQLAAQVGVDADRAEAWVRVASAARV